MAQTIFPTSLAVLVALTALAGGCGGSTQVTSPGGPGAADSDELSDEVVPVAPINQGSVPECVTITALGARSVAGFNHIVRLDNACERDVDCQVATNSAPDPIDATVSAGERSELTLFRGHGERDFTPQVDCSLR
ncbi:MAG: hypothetical protein DRJ42_05090 [Deltaproteobacteria bacterium]|nr:MAG: hypothetical protein DRJ42_05090 [Deltaproteobacteria bacterium]